MNQDDEGNARGRRMEGGCHREAGLMAVKDGFNSMVLDELSHLGRRVQGSGKCYFISKSSGLQTQPLITIT